MHIDGRYVSGYGFALARKRFLAPTSKDLLVANMVA